MASTPAAPLLPLVLVGEPDERDLRAIAAALADRAAVLALPLSLHYASGLPLPAGAAALPAHCVVVVLVSCASLLSLDRAVQSVRALPPLYAALGRVAVVFLHATDARRAAFDASGEAGAFAQQGLSVHFWHEPGGNTAADQAAAARVLGIAAAGARAPWRSAHPSAVPVHALVR